MSMVHLAVLCSHPSASTHEFSVYQIFIGERSFLGVGHVAVALWDDTVIRKSDTLFNRTLTKELNK